jgi:hypothetical protein
MILTGENATIAVWDESGGDNSRKKSPLRMKRASRRGENLAEKITPGYQR